MLIFEAERQKTRNEKRIVGCMVVILARLLVGYPIPKRPVQDQNKHGRNGGRSESRAGRNKEDQESPVRQTGASASDSMNNTSEYVIDTNNNCVSCGTIVTEADNGAACQWCSRWEHSVCTGLNATDYNMLSGSFPKITFFLHKVPT